MQRNWNRVVFTAEKELDIDVGPQKINTGANTRNKAPIIRAVAGVTAALVIAAVAVIAIVMVKKRRTKM